MKKLVTSLILSLGVCFNATPCTIFCFTQNGKTYFCNNEDFSNPDTEIQFYPGTKKKYAWVYFGFSNDWAQGGVNEKGLCWDWVAEYNENDWKEDRRKKNFNGNLSEKMITECETVEEAIKFYEKYNEASFSYARTMIADRFGNSVIIGWKNGEMDIQRNTNNLQAFGYGGQNVESYFSKNPGERNIAYLAGALNAAHQEGQYPTQYSNIISLSDGKIYLYKDHDYSEYVEIDYLEKLNNDYSKYKISELFDTNKSFSAISLVKQDSTDNKLQGYGEMIADDPESFWYLGQEEPSDTPAVFQLPKSEGFFTAERVAISSDNREIYYTELTGYGTDSKIRSKYFKFNGESWDGPCILSEEHGGPSLSPDNNVLFLEDHYLTKNDSGWEVPARFSKDSVVHYLQQTNSGNYYFLSFVNDSTTDVFRMSINQQDTITESLGLNMKSTVTNDYCMDPDETFILTSLNSTEIECYGWKDIFIRFKTEEGWSEPQNLGKKINTEVQVSRWGMSLSNDKKFMFFTTGSTPSDCFIYWVRVDDLFKQLKENMNDM